MNNDNPNPNNFTGQSGNDVQWSYPASNAGQTAHNNTQYAQDNSQGNQNAQSSQYTRYGAPQGFPQPVYQPKRSAFAEFFTPHNVAIISFILGLAAVVLAFVDGIGIIPGIIGLVLADHAKKRGGPDGFATAGTVLSIIALCLSVIGLVMLVACIGCGACAMFI